MSRQSFSVQFTKEQVQYLMNRLGVSTTEEAMEMFATAIRQEGVDPTKMPLYVNKLMEMDKNANR